MADRNITVLIKGNSSQLQSELSKTSSMIKSSFSGIGSILAGAFSIGSIVSMGKAAIDLGSQLSDASKKFGVAATELSALQFVAKVSGVDFEALGGSFKFLAKSIAGAEDPTSKYALAFKALGFTMQDLRSKTPDEIFMRLADRFSEMEDGANKTALSLVFFGRAGADILPVFEKGAAGIKQLKDEAVRMGATLTDEQIKKLDAYGDVIDKLGMTAKATAGRGLTELIDKIKAVWETVAKYGPGIEGAIFDMGVMEFGPNAQHFKAPPLPKPSPKMDTPNIAAMMEAEKIKKKAIEDAAAAAKKLTEEILRHDAAKYKAEGQLAHEALAAEMGYDQEYFDAVTKMRMDDFSDWKKGQEEEAALLEKFDMDQIRGLQGLQDAQREELEITEKISEYRAEDAFAAAMAYGDATNEIRLLNEGLYEHFRILGEGREKVAAFSRLYDFAFRGMDGLTADLTNAAVDGFNRMTDALTDFVMTGKANFTDFANSVISDIMRIMIQQSIVQPIAQGLMGAFGMSAPISGKASGGSVFGGTPYLVGERGPELFVPGASGTIVPNGGGGNVTVNIRNEGGQPVQAQSAKASFDGQGMIVDVVIDAINRNVHGLRTVLGGA